jgi:hypothetical protein
MRHRHAAGFYRMLQLNVTAFPSYLEPSIGFKDVDDVTAIHANV